MLMMLTKKFLLSDARSDTTTLTVKVQNSASDTTTTTLLPNLSSDSTLVATFLILSMSPTEVPPNF